MNIFFKSFKFQVKTIHIVLIVLLQLIEISFQYRLAAEFIAKMTKIQKLNEIDITDTAFSTCKNNPLIKIFPDALATELIESFDDGDLLVVKKESLKGCNIFNSPKDNCCSDDTLSIYKQYIKDEILLIKKRIYEKNSKIYDLIINEHNRNFNAFQISQDIFEKMFEKYKLIDKAIRYKHERILNETLSFSWNSFCNLICRKPEDLKNYCQIYNETIAVNEKEYWKLKYNCSLDYDHLNTINNLLVDFDNFVKTINSTLDEYYSDIYKESKILAESISNSSNSVQLRNLETNNSIVYDNGITNLDVKYYLENSIKDGHYVSKSLTQLSYCNNLDVKCEGLLNKTCIPFYCYDDLFLQFSDSTTIDYETILKNTSYISVDIKPKNVNNNNLFIRSDIEKDEYLNEILNEVVKIIKIEYLKSSVITMLLIIIFLQ